MKHRTLDRACLISLLFSAISFSLGFALSARAPLAFVFCIIVFSPGLFAHWFFGRSVVKKGSSFWWILIPSFIANCAIGYVSFVTWHSVFDGVVINGGGEG